MSQRWLLLAPVGLAVCGLVAAVVLRGAEEDTLAPIIQQYEATAKKQVNRSSADDLYAVAKWCLLNQKAGEAQAVAVEANQKFPDDVRVKYLLYTLAGGTGGTLEPVEDKTEMAEATLSDDEVDAIYKTEGDTTMRLFREVQSKIVGSCGKAKCHGGENPKSKWVLIRKDLSGRKTLAENFQTINKYITRKPGGAGSTLLQTPLKGPDAGHPLVAFRGGTSDPIYKTLLDFINSLKGKGDLIWGDAATAPAPAPPGPKPGPAPPGPKPAPGPPGPNPPVIK